MNVAVIIPTLNEEKFIEACLESVRQQTYPFQDMDVMVVDGGSSDNTQMIVREYGKKYPNVRLLQNPDRIQSVAFNVGCKNTDADVIIRLDAHALYSNTYVERCVMHLKENQQLGNVGGIWDIKPQHKGLVAEANALLNKSRFGIGGASYRVGSVQCYTDTVPFGAFPKYVIDKIGGMREDLPRGEDNEYNHRIRKAGYKILLDPKIVATYFARDTLKGSVSQMYKNGVSIAKLFFIDIDIISVRHIVPLYFVCALFIGGILSVISKPVALATLGMIALYVLFDIFASMIACRNHRVKCILVLPVMFPAVHIFYGLGTLIGLMGGVIDKYKYWPLAALMLPLYIIWMPFKLVSKRS